MSSINEIVLLTQYHWQEMANPHVRPHLHFYPEDTGKTVAEYYQAAHWRELDDNPHKFTPMAAIKDSHYYLYEPCILSDGQVCMPYEWFYRDEKLHASVWMMRAFENSWIVEEYNSAVLSQDDFLVNFVDWDSSYLSKSCPKATKIAGVQLKQDSTSLSPWTRTNPIEGNCWRGRAKGAHVFSFPIWLYCDDTSGNQSKKWNKHNSFLFIPGGLPRSYVHLEYNIHFLCTSNIAPPLEMLDGIVEQLE